MKRHLLRCAVCLIFCAPASLYSFQNSFVGIWEFTNDTGTSFLVEIKDDFTVVSTYSRAEDSLAPEEGFWHLSGEELYIMYNNGWLDVIRSNKGSYTKTAYAPGQSVSKKQGKSSQVFKTGRKELWGPVNESDYVGYWQLNDENDKPFYLHIKADHTARSTYTDGENGVFGEVGTWRFEHNRIMVVYDSGWIDCIMSTVDGLHKYAFAPGQRLNTRPNNSSPVHRASEEDLKMRQ